jgi:hypothetical protein
MAREQGMSRDIGSTSKTKNRREETACRESNLLNLELGALAHPTTWA